MSPCRITTKIERKTLLLSLFLSETNFSLKNARGSIVICFRNHFDNDPKSLPCAIICLRSAIFALSLTSLETQETLVPRPGAPLQHGKGLSICFISLLLIILFLWSSHRTVLKTPLLDPSYSDIPNRQNFWGFTSPFPSLNQVPILSKIVQILVHRVGVTGRGLGKHT